LRANCETAGVRRGRLLAGLRRLRLCGLLRLLRGHQPVAVLPDHIGVAVDAGALVAGHGVPIAGRGRLGSVHSGIAGWCSCLTIASTSSRLPPPSAVELTSLILGLSVRVTSATHGEAELKDTVRALRNAVRMLRQAGEI